MKIIKTKLKKNNITYQPDWEVDNNWLEVKIHLTGLRIVRDVLLQLACAASEQFCKEAILLLIEPNISYNKLCDEWKKLGKIFRPEVFKRLNIVIFQDGQFSGISSDPKPELTDALLEVCNDEILNKQNLLPRSNFKAEIYKILILDLLTDKGATTSDKLAKTAGCNYRTVASVLTELGNALIRHSDRKVELKYFPGDAWEWLLVNLNKSRLTKRYSDRSGQPRSIDSLLKRLAKIEHINIAVAGTLGAQHIYPEIDLIGTPRLDLTVHSPDKYLNFDFIKKLDPALKEELNPEKPVSLVVHCVRRKEAFFTTDSNGIVWADPVECLLDLHEMRLEPQALELLNFLQTKGINT
jgi:hypothetical protein